ncbi:MAG: hypothetical protein V4696_00715 [Pseudomonadota bacterium]
MTEEIAQREDTMIYRAPTPDSTDVQDIWGKQLEVKVVDAPEVDGFLADGWVTNPLHIDHPPKSNDDAGGVVGTPAADALAAAEKLIDELTDQNADLTAKLADAETSNTALTDNLKAAEELANEESKAKEAALARIAELEAPPKLSAKPKPA